MKKNQILAGMLILACTYSCKKPLDLVSEGPAAQQSVSQLTAVTSVPTAITGVSSTPLFEDNFLTTTTGFEFDTLKWILRVGSMSKFDNKSINKIENLNTTTDGVLEINYKAENPSTNTYSGGGLISRKAMGYGYYEAKIALFTGSAGLHQSFWSLGTTHSALYNDDLTPHYNQVVELDGIEADSKDAVGEYNNHVWSPTHSSPFPANLGTFITWVTIGYDWRKDRVDYYVDNVKKGTRYLTGVYDVYAQQNLWLTALFTPTSSGSPGWYDFGGNVPLTDPNAKMKVAFVRYYPSTEVGVNLIGNPSFEYNSGSTAPLQDPISWIENRKASSYSDPNASKVQNMTGTGGAHSGSFGLSHDGTSNYFTTTKQIINYLPNGSYKLTAWVKGSVHVTPSKMRALGPGMTEKTIDLPVTNTWQLITIDNINVTNNEATIAFTSNALAGEWIAVDDVKFEKK